MSIRDSSSTIKIHDRLDRILAAHLRDFGQRFAGERLQFLRFETDQQDSVGRAGGEIKIFPLVTVDLRPRPRFSPASPDRADA